MRSALLVALLLTGCASGRPAISDASLIGTWECGPTTMHGPNFDLLVTTRTTNNADHTYSSLTTSVVTPQGGLAVTNKDLAHGTWQLDGDVITSTVTRVEFLSSTDATISNKFGQDIQDAQLKKKSVYQSRIIHFDGQTSRSIPVNSMYKEAVVESSCKRV
jgi:hypothetical protein